MAQADFNAPPTMRVAAPKPKMTVYYALLIIALTAILVGCLLLYLEIKRFGGFGAVPQRIATVEQAERAVLATEITEELYHGFC